MHTSNEEGETRRCQVVRIQRNINLPITDFEESVAKELNEFVNRNKDLDYPTDLYIRSAMQYVLYEGEKVCKAIAITYPFRLMEFFRKIHLKLVTDLGMKFIGNDVFLIPRRNLDPTPLQGYSLVYDAMMKDIVYPTEIVGRRIVCEDESEDDDGCEYFEYFLDMEASKLTKEKDTFAMVFYNLCLFKNLRRIEVRFKGSEA